MFVYLLYIKEDYVNIFRVTIDDVQDDPCLILCLVYDIWVCSIYETSFTIVASM